VSKDDRCSKRVNSSVRLHYLIDRSADAIIFNYLYKMSEALNFLRLRIGHPFRAKSSH
jgi:hypothetical protein